MAITEAIFNGRDNKNLNQIIEIMFHEVKESMYFVKYINA